MVKEHHSLGTEEGRAALIGSYMQVHRPRLYITALHGGDSFCEMSFRKPSCWDAVLGSNSPIGFIICGKIVW